MSKSLDKNGDSPVVGVAGEDPRISGWLDRELSPAECREVEELYSLQELSRLRESQAWIGEMLREGQALNEREARVAESVWQSVLAGIERVEEASGLPPQIEPARGYLAEVLEVAREVWQILSRPAVFAPACAVMVLIAVFRLGAGESAVSPSPLVASRQPSEADVQLADRGSAASRGDLALAGGASNANSAAELMRVEREHLVLVAPTGEFFSERPFSYLPHQRKMVSGSRARELLNQSLAQRQVENQSVGAGEDEDSEIEWIIAEREVKIVPSMGGKVPMIWVSE